MTFVRPAGRVRWGWALACFAAILCSAAPGSAEPGRACTRTGFASFDHISRVRAYNVTACAERTVGGRYTSAEEFDACVALKEANHLQSARNRAQSRLATRCTPAPAFGYSDATTIVDTATEWYLEVSRDVFGAGLGDMMIGAGASMSACRLQALRGIGELRTAEINDIGSCVRSQGITFDEWTAPALTECVTTGLSGSERLSRAIENFQSQLADACSGMNAADAFPGATCAGSASVADAASCIVARTRCHVCRMTESALDMALPCDLIDNGQDDQSCPSVGSGCGDGTRGPREACDGSDLGGQTCQSQGFFTGELACTSTCSLDTRDCSDCGDGTIDDGEVCDASNLAGETCTSLGFTHGELACSDECQLDTADCTTCGDGLIGGAEQCDGANLGDQTCQSVGRGGGVLSCTPSCELVDSACYDCGDGNVNPGEQCDGTNLNGATCESLGFLTGDLACTGECTYDPQLCFETCDSTHELPPDLKFAPGDELLFLGDSVTASFIQRRDHYGRITRKILGATYCDLAAGFTIDAVGVRASHYGRYARMVGRTLAKEGPSLRRWIMFQDAGRSLGLAEDRFQDAVRETAASAHVAEPSARLLFATTPPFEEKPDESHGTCRYYGKQCNYSAHNDILVQELVPELGAHAVPWAEDLCRLEHLQAELLPVEFTQDGIHPEPVGNLALALSLLKWAGVPREHLVLNGLADLHPQLDDLDLVNRVADWIYSSSIYDCTRLSIPCAEPEPECATYLEQRGL